MTEEQDGAEAEPRVAFDFGIAMARDDYQPEHEGRMIFPTRFFRMELVAC